MKKQVLTMLGMAGLLVLLGASTASAGSIELWADIPFDFMAGDKMLPAGTYNVGRAGASHTVLHIQNRHRDGAVLVQANISQPANSGGTTRLVFNRYGERYFLSQIWTALRSDGYMILKSGPERELAREFAAKGKGGPTAVSVAAAVP